MHICLLCLILYFVYLLLDERIVEITSTVLRLCPYDVWNRWPKLVFTNPNHVLSSLLPYKQINTTISDNLLTKAAGSSVIILYNAYVV